MVIKKKDQVVTISYRAAGEKCNYNCPYCNINGFRTKNVDETLKYLIQHQDYIHYNLGTLLELIPNSEIDIKGGEPCLMPLSFWSNMVSYIPIRQVTFYTNLSESIDYYSKLNEIFKDFPFKIDAAYHPFVPIKAFIKKVKQVDNCVVHFTVNDKYFVGEKVLQELDNFKLVKIVDKKNKNKETVLKNPYLKEYFSRPEPKQYITDDGIELSQEELNCLPGGKCVPSKLLLEFGIGGMAIKNRTCEYKKHALPLYGLPIDNKVLSKEELKEFIEGLNYDCNRQANEYKPCKPLIYER